VTARAIGLGVLLALSAGASAALADEADDLRSLLSENVITTASTSAEKASTAPATSVTITAEELRTYGIRTLAEAIDFLSIGLVTSDPLGAPEVGARGVLLRDDQGKHVLLLVNGHALNDPLIGAARFDEGAGVPFDMIDHIEVIVGPGSVLYGSNAMLGVVNVITKSGPNYAGGHLVGEYEIGRVGHASAGAGMTFKLFGSQGELTIGADYTSRFGPDLDFGLVQTPINQGTGTLQIFRRGGPADGLWGGKLRDAYFTQAPAGVVRLRVGDFELNLMGSLYRRGIPYTTQATNVDFDDPKSYEMDRAVRLDLKHQATLTSLIQLTSRVYADSYDHQRQVNRNAVAGCFRGDFETCSYYDAGLARWAGIEERISFNWVDDMSLVTLLGVDARMRWVRAKEDATDFDTGKPFARTAGLIDDSSPIVSPYVQQTWAATRWLDLNAGARVDADARYSPIVSPRGAVAVTPISSMVVRAIYSQAFRAPTWEERDSASYRLAPAADIKPEKVRSLEASIEQRLGTQRILVGLFRTWWDDLLELLPLTPAESADLQRGGVLPIAANSVAQYHNLTSIVNYGWNGGWEGSLVDGRLSYGFNVTEAFTRQEAPGQPPRPLVLAPQLFGNLHAAYAFGGFLPTPAIAVRYIGARPPDRLYDTPYFATLPEAKPLADIRLTLSGRIPGLRGLAYRLSAAYASASHGAYVAGPATEGARMPMNPVDQFRVLVGLRYDFFTGERGASEDVQ
jgi:outer membrane receptor protein involved in Fe transport